MHSFVRQTLQDAALKSMKSTLLALSCAAAFVWIGNSAAMAGVIPKPGDLLVNVFGFGKPSSIGHYDSTGAFIQSFTGPGNAWLGAASLPDGRIATTVRDPQLLRIFNPADMSYVDHPIPEINGSAPGDIAVFHDGTIAIADQENPEVSHSAIEIYNSSGQHLRSIGSLNMSGALGLFVDQHDHLWALNLYPDGSVTGGSRIFEFDKAGNLLTQFTTSWKASDLVRDSAGNLWVSNWHEQRVMHLAPNGNLIDSFLLPSTHQFTNHFASIAMGLDGTIFATARRDLSIFQFDQNGQILNSFPNVTLGMNPNPNDTFPAFMDVVGVVPEPPAIWLAVLAIAMVAIASKIGKRRFC
jgi:hypothetical protein